MNDRKTWIRDTGGLVSWSYQPVARSNGRFVPLDLREWGTRKRWVCDLVGRLPALLGDFAHLGKVHATSWGSGDDCEVDGRDQAGQTRLLEFLQQTEPIEVQADLELTCLDRNLEPFEINLGATLWINMWVDESGSLYLTKDAPVYLRFVLNADIYAYWSFGDVQDNAFLAALNGPRLTAFLERIETDVPAQFLDMDGERYGGLVGPKGFKVPPNTVRGA
jgi:hypothetical protein